MLRLCWFPARRGLGFENTDSTLRGGGNSWEFL